MGMKAKKYEGRGLDEKILTGQQFRQDVYVNGSIVKSDRDAGRFNFNPVSRQIANFSSEGAYHVSEGEAYRPPYKNGYVSVYYKNVSLPTAFQNLDIPVHPGYGYACKYDMTTGETLVKVGVPKARDDNPAFLSEDGVRLCFLTGVFYDTNGLVTESKDYYIDFDTYSALQSFCTTYSLDVPLSSSQFDDSWIYSCVVNSSGTPITLKAYVEVSE